MTKAQRKALEAAKRPNLSLDGYCDGSGKRWSAVIRQHPPSEVRARCEAATEGPEWGIDGEVIWGVEVREMVEPDCCGQFNPDGSCCGVPIPRPYQEQHQVQIGGGPAYLLALLNCARTDIPALLAIIEEQRETMDRMKSHYRQAAAERDHWRAVANGEAPEVERL